MTANSCPNNTWNHTDGCVCAPNGSITAEVDADLAAFPTPVNVLDRAAGRLGDPAWTAAHPTLAGLYRDEDFLDNARAMTGKPMSMVAQHIQEHDDGPHYTFTTDEFDVADVMAVFDDDERTRVAEVAAASGADDDQRPYQKKGTWLNKGSKSLDYSTPAEYLHRRGRETGTIETWDDETFTEVEMGMGEYMTPSFAHPYVKPPEFDLGNTHLAAWELGNPAH